MKLEDRLCKISITLIVLLLIFFVDFLIISPLWYSYDYKKNHVQITKEWEWDNILKRLNWHAYDGGGEDIIFDKIIDFVSDSTYILVAQKPQYSRGINYKCGIDSIYYWIIDTSDNRKSGPLLRDEFNQQKRELGITINFSREIYPDQKALELTAVDYKKRIVGETERKPYTDNQRPK